MNEETFDDAKIIRGEQRWGSDTLCLKKRPVGDEKPSIMGYTAFGVITQPARKGQQITIYLQPDFLKFDAYMTVEDMLAAGWIVD